MECYKKNDLFSIPGRDFHLQEKKTKELSKQEDKLKQRQRGKKKATETMTYQDRVRNKCKQPV